MDIDYLNEFIVLTELNNLADAAKKLTISESSLSRHMKALENDFGCNLFDRSSRTLRLSANGRIVLPYARECVALRRRCMTDLEKAGLHRASPVTVVCNYYIGNILADFMKAYPGTTTKIIGGPNDTESELRRLRSKDCAFAFIMDFNDPQNEFLSIPFATDHNILCVPTSHPLADRETVSLKEFRHDRFVSCRTGSCQDIQLKKLCHQAGFEPQIAVTGDTGISLVGFVRQRLGVTLLHQNVLISTGTDVSGVKLLDLDPPSSFTVSLVRNRDAALSPAETDFLDYCMAHRSSEF